MHSLQTNYDFTMRYSLTTFEDPIKNNSTQPTQVSDLNQNKGTRPKTWWRKRT